MLLELTIESLVSNGSNKYDWLVLLQTGQGLHCEHGPHITHLQ